MSRHFSKENPKDCFITQHLLLYLFKQHINSSNADNDSVANIFKMYIFPYRTQTGYELGSLMDEGVSWYYLNNPKDTTVSSSSFRIFADELFDQKDIGLLHQIFTEKNVMSVFSQDSIIISLIKQMSQENDYTDLWWKCAYDLFPLTDSSRVGIDLSGATKSISNNCFLFVDDNCTPELKKNLIKYGVFTDVLKQDKKGRFLERIEPLKRNLAIDFLKKLGIPYTFIDSKDEVINENILIFAESLENLHYPCSKNYPDEYEKCRFAHELFWDYIYKKSPDALLQAIHNEYHSYGDGIHLRNMAGSFVPLYWDLFYSENDLQLGYVVNVFNESDEDFEYCHINPNLYDRGFLNKCRKLHRFDQIAEPYEQFELGLADDSDSEMKFYKWIWQYSKHKELGELILSCLSGKENEEITVDIEYSPLVLEVIQMYKEILELNDYSFEIGLIPEIGFKYSEGVNICSRTDAITTVITKGEYFPIDTSLIVEQICDCIPSQSKRLRIKNDPIWSSVYEWPSDHNDYDGIYLNTHFYNDDENDDSVYEDALLLCKGNSNSHLRALINYVNDFQSANLDPEIFEPYDWKNAYISLVENLQNFIRIPKPDISIPEQSNSLTNCGNISTFRQEKRLWRRMVEEREIIFGHSTDEIPVKTDAWREYLQAQYGGRCQLCGSKTITGFNNAHFYTYRMIRPRDSRLADLNSNLLCLCPTCHGALRYGSYMGVDLTSILDASDRYVEYLEKHIQANDLPNSASPLIAELCELQKPDKIPKGFNNPLVCVVTVNGVEQPMAFSWDHFIRIAFMLSETENKQLRR